MLYYLFTYLDKLDFPGAGMFQYLTFRGVIAFITSMLIALFFGKKIIHYLQLKQIGETVRDLGLEGQMQKKGTPTMGGIIILLSIIIPTILFCELRNVYIILMLVTTLWLGFIGFLDDYIKVFKKDKQGLQGKFKVLGQITLGIIVGLTFYFSPQVVVREKNANNITINRSSEVIINPEEAAVAPSQIIKETKSTTTHHSFY